jgi:hypothetical protein
MEAHQVTMEAHHDAVEAHHGSMEAHHGAMEAHHGAMEAHQVIIEAHHGAQEAHLGAVEAHHSALEAHQGSVFSSWRHFPWISRLRFRHHKKLDRFKRRYHGFAPMIEIDQTVSSSSYYVALNGFMFFKTRGLIKNLNKDPAGHP